MRYLKLLGVLCLLGGSLWAQLPANILVQGAVFSGGPAPANWPSGSPFTVGIPMADADAIPGTLDSSPNNLKLCTTSDCSSGRQAAQFRVLGKWPSGNAKWVLVDGQTTEQVTPTTFSNSLYLVKSASGGNYGGSLTVTDSNSADPNSGTITVATGTATFVIRKANFDLFHKVTLGSSTVIVDDARTLGNDGLVLMGPPSSRDRTGVSNNPAACNAAYPTAYVQPGELSTPSAHTFTAGQESNCSTAYLSNLDSASKAVVAESGGLRAVIKVTGSLADAAAACSDDGVTETAHCYTHYTARLTFYSGQSYAKVQVTHRNAAFATAANFNSAAKQFASLNAQVTLTLGSGNKTATVGNCEVTGIGGCSAPPGPTVDTAFTGTDNLYIYQAFSKYLEWGDWNSEANASGGACQQCLVSYIHRNGSKVYDQNGYLIVKNGSAIGPAGTSGATYNVYPAGYADLKDSTGLGLETGVYQFSAYWPKSLQFQNVDGTHARALVGIWPDQGLYLSGGDQPYVQSWPMASIHDAFFNFHASSLASPSDSFHRLQENLIARVVPYTYYNHAKDARAGYGNLQALMYPLTDPIAHDSYAKDWNSNYCVGGRTAGNCLRDAVYVSSGATWPNVSIFRHWIWTAGGTGNQSSWDWALLRNWVNRGCTADGNGKCTVASLSGSEPGRYLMAMFWARFMAEQVLPRSDFYGGWRGDGTGGTQASCIAAELVPEPHQCDHLSAWGFPGAFSGIKQPVVSWNGGVENFGDNPNGMEHAWYHGLPDSYFLSGDESIKDQLLQGYKDTYLSKNVKDNEPAVGNTPGISTLAPTRTVGHRLSGHARASIFLASIGDAEADTTSLTLSDEKGKPLYGADNAVLYGVSPDLPMPYIAALGTHPEQAGENEPSGNGCVAPWGMQGCTGGVSRTRGQHLTSQMQYGWPYGASCPGPDCHREFGMVMHDNVLIQGLWEYRLAALSLRGKNWLMGATVNGYAELTGDKPALNYLYGVSQGFANDQYATVGPTLTATSSQGPTALTYPDFLNWTDLSATCGGRDSGRRRNRCSDSGRMQCLCQCSRLQRHLADR